MVQQFSMQQQYDAAATNRQSLFPRLPSHSTPYTPRIVLQVKASVNRQSLFPRFPSHSLSTCLHLLYYAIHIPPSLPPSPQSLPLPPSLPPSNHSPYLYPSLSDPLPHPKNTAPTTARRRRQHRATLPPSCSTSHVATSSLQVARRPLRQARVRHRALSG